MKVCLVILKIFSGNEILNEILTSVEGLTLYQMYNNRNLDLVDFNAFTNFGKLYQFGWQLMTERVTDEGKDRMMDNSNPVYSLCGETI